MTDFKATPQDNTTPIERRKSTDLLPSGVGFIKDSDSLKKFLGATLDQWIQKPQIENRSGYIGQKSGLYYKPDLDFYLQESDKTRNDYQLEPSTISIDNNQNIDFVNFYQDVTNHLKFHGSFINNHNRLYSQEYYSWNPNVNPDMLVNFSNYYWLVSGPTTITISEETNAVLDIIGQSHFYIGDIVFKSGMRIVLTNDVNTDYNKSFIVEGVGDAIRLVVDSEFDGFGLYDSIPYDTGPYDSVSNITPDYITIERGGQDRNPWSRNNRWFHKDLITNLNLEDFSIFQARRPIIEFKYNLELYNYGRIARQSVDLICSDIAILDVTGLSSLKIDGTDVIDGQRILFTNDPDPEKNNRIYTVFGLEAYNKIGLLLNTDGLDYTGAPVELEKVRVLSGEINRNKEYYYINGEWKPAQSKNSPNQEPLFVLYDSENIRLDDVGVYPQSNFTGSKIFEYVKDTTRKNDIYLGFPINFDTFGNIQFNNVINTQRFNYVLNFTTTNIDGYYYFRKFINFDPSLDLFLNEWSKASIESRQYIKDNYVINEIHDDDGSVEFNREYTLSIKPDNNEENMIPNLLVYLNGISLEQNVDYSVDNNIVELSLSLDLKDNDVLEITSYANKIDKVGDNGFFEIPKNLEMNPTNQEVGVITYSELYNHFISIINNQIGFSGIAYGSNNYKDTPRDTSRGSYILQHTAPLTNLMLMNSSSNNLDFTNAIRYSNREYTRFKKKLINKINDLYLRGYNETVPTSSWLNDAFSAINIGKTSDFPFSFSGMTGNNNYIPSTPSVLGVLPLYTPEKFLDTTRITPVNVIRGHDGSIIEAYDNIIDDVILSFENLIYDNVISYYKNKEIVRELEYLTIKPGYFRNCIYTKDEWKSLTQSGFERWVVDQQIEYKTNTIFDPNNRFTWNYSKSHNRNGDLLDGGWRAIYNYYFDTDRPHTHPWEMLGFGQKPDWWDSHYGSAPYTGANLIMWSDIETGTIAMGDRKGTYEYLAREGVLNIIPVDEFGNLLDPISANISVDIPNAVFAAEDWKFGDIGPGEYAWRISENYSFSTAEALFLSEPAKFINFLWEPKDFIRVNGQYVDKDTLKRRKPSEYTVHNELLTDGTLSVNYGISQWISSYLTSIGQDIKSNFGDKIRNLSTQLGYKIGGFTKNNSLRLISDNFGIVPQEDVNIRLNKSSSISQPIYSAIMIEWTGKNYRVFGYDTIGQKFKTIPGKETGQKSKFTVEDVSITKYLTSSNKIEEVLYGTEFGSREALYNFMLSYQRWLEREGWMFDEIEPTSNKIKDFNYSAEQFIIWTLNKLSIGDMIVFSPLANISKIKVPHGIIDDVQVFVNGVYSVLDKTGFGISTKDFNISRLEDLFSINITSDDGKGIYCLRLSIVEYEHILLLNNVTKFNDLIYNPLLGLRQLRFRTFLQRPLLWSGKPEALGYIIQDNTLIDNFETTTSDMEEYFGTKNLETTSQINSVAKHLIGYQDRDYLENLLISKTSQFEFYRGFIREKGTNNSFTKILRNSFVAQTAGYEVLEEWAFLLGDYGNVTKKSSIQLNVIQENFKTNPQQIIFTESDVDNPEDNIISITPDDSRWVQKRPDNQTIDQFSLRGFQNKSRIDLPNSGYIRTDEAAYSVVFKDELSGLYDTVKLAGNTLNDGDIIWNIIAPNSSWNAYRVCSLSKVSEIQAGEEVGDPGIIITEGETDLVSGDIIYINGSTESSPDFEGYQEVDSIIDSSTFTISNPISTPKTFDSDTGPLVVVLRPVRFSTNTDRDNFEPINGWLEGDKTFIDNVNGLWSVYKWNGSSWDLDRVENDKIDIDQIFNSIIYNSRTNQTDVQLNLIDPFKGYISGNADRELYYKLAFDPAKYTNGDVSRFQIDTSEAWSINQVGRLWWDFSTSRFLNYEQGELEYRFKNWGKLAPGTTIDIYEWTRSPVPPSSWDSYVLGAPSITDYRPSGTLKYGNEQPYVQTQEFNQSTNRFETFYYFWVLNPSFTPSNIESRRLSALSVSQLISDPNTQGISWIAPVDTYAFLLCNVDNLINDESNLQINFFIDSEDSIIHHEWKLMRENDSVNSPDEFFWNKLRDSLVGFDDLNLVVPDMNLKPIERYGTKYRPRQSWFKDRLQARKEFSLKANKILTNKNVINISSTWDDNLHAEDPQPDSSQYDYIVFNRNDRDALVGTIIAGKKVLVESDQVFNGHWSLWQYDGGTSFTLLSKQLYKVEDYWFYIDWYDQGYSSSTRITQTFNTISDRNSGTFSIGDIIKVLDNGLDKWSLYYYDVQNSLPTFILIGEEQGTINFNTSLLSSYDLNDSNKDEEVSIVTKNLIRSLRVDLLSALEQNLIFFNMIHYVHIEQFVIDWAFKTSYIYGVGDVNLLSQNYIFTKDQGDNLITYINEVKPYHVKVRGLIDQKQVPDETLNVSIQDSHTMNVKLIYDRVVSTSSIPDDANPADYDLDTLNAADRIKLLYKPTEGMPEKVLSQLISRTEFGGTVLDGKNFYQFGTSLTAGYDGSPYDNMLGYDFEASDIENFYDVFVNGGAFNPAAPEGASDIIVDGYKFIQPDIEEDHPEELVKSRIGDSVVIDVYTMSIGSVDTGFDAEGYDVFGYDYDASDIGIPFGGRPRVRAKRYISDGYKNQFSIGQMPQNRQALFVYVGSILLKETVDYTVDWSVKDPIVNLNSTPVSGTKIKIVSFSIGGSSVIKRKLIRNTSNDTFDLGISYGDINQVFATVDGEIATFTGDGTSITITNPTPSNSTVFIAVFQNNLYSKILTQEEIASGGIETFTIDRPAYSTTPINYATTIIHKNGLRLAPPYIKVYDVTELDDRYFKIGTKPTSADNVRVWVDSVELVNGADFNVIISDSEVQLVNSPQTDSFITIMLTEKNQFEITGINNDQLTILDGNGNPLSLNNGDSIKITTFSEDVSLGMRTEVFDGNVLGFYPLGDRPFDTNSVWATVNGEKKIYLSDYVLTDKDNGYDSEFTGYGILYDSDMNFGVDFKNFAHNSDPTQGPIDRVIITYFTTRPTADPIAFRLFKNIFGNWENLRISDDYTTKLVQDMDSGDTEIVVQDSTVLGQPNIDKNVPGIVFINGERIIFWEVDTSIEGAHILKRVLRGTAGTGINVLQSVDTIVRDGSKIQTIPGGYYWSITPNGLQQETSVLAKFLLDKPGTFEFTI